MALNLAKTVLRYLKTRPEEKLTTRQIAEWVFAECQQEKANSRSDYTKTDADVLAQT